MGKPQRKKKTGQVKNKYYKRLMKQKNVGGYDDLIYENLTIPEKIDGIKNKDADVSLPGLG
jgi:hypothetical protein